MYLQIVKEGSNDLFLSKIYCDFSDMRLDQDDISLWLLAIHLVLA